MLESGSLSVSLARSRSRGLAPDIVLLSASPETVLLPGACAVEHEALEEGEEVTAHRVILALDASLDVVKAHFVNEELGHIWIAPGRDLHDLGDRVEGLEGVGLQGGLGLVLDEEAAVEDDAADLKTGHSVRILDEVPDPPEHLHPPLPVRLLHPPLVVGVEVAADLGGPLQLRL